MQVSFPRGALAPAAALLLTFGALRAAPPKPMVAPVAPTDAYLDETRGRWIEVSDAVWGFSETSLKETKSAALLASVLEKEGFTVTRGVAGMPTAFVATAGSGTPVIGILAEYDALPGLSQVAGETAKKPAVEGAPGHGCGHNLLGTAAVAAAVATNRQRIEGKLPGTIRLFGTPAEEQIIGKIFMLRDGIFGGTDVVLSWHPGSSNYLYTPSRLAITAIDVEFFGKTAHAAAAPWLGRSALDALEVFDHAIALMREHVLPTARMHRVIKDGGVAANIIPDYARVQYFVRDATGASMNEMLGRVRQAAEGAALATETRSKVTLLATTREPVYNVVLSRVMQKELEHVGAPPFDAADAEFAKAIQKELGFEARGLAQDVTPFGPGHGETASSDIGEVSAAFPLAELSVATRPLGTPAHHWAQTTCASVATGKKGMLVAAKVLAASAVDLLKDPASVAAAKAELVKATDGKPYVSPLTPDQKPATY
jgi:aminobenzoyl-glutamate utilization protein B